MNWAKAESTKGRSSSFRAALDYALHDKRAKTSERVGAVEIINLGSDREGVWKEMRATAAAARTLQARNRTRTGRREQASGSKIEKPVFSISLNWHPDDKPTPSHMMEKAREALKLLGLQEHQAVLVQHKERPHAHVHVIVNLVHPKTGLMASLHRDEIKLDAWAHRYEAGQNVIRSFKRAAKHERRQLPDRSKGAVVRESYLREKERLDARHRSAAALRDQQVKTLWDGYRITRGRTQDRYQALLDESERRHKTNPALTPKPPGGRTTPEWMLLARALATHPEPLSLRRKFSIALRAVTQSKESPLARVFRQKKEGIDLNVPIKAVNRKTLLEAAKQGTADLRSARDNELAALSRRFEERRVALDTQHATELHRERQEVSDLKVQTAQRWAKMRTDFEQAQRPTTPEQAPEQAAALEELQAAEQPAAQQSVADRMMQAWRESQAAEASQQHDYDEGRSLSDEFRDSSYPSAE